MASKSLWLLCFCLPLCLSQTPCPPNFRLDKSSGICVRICSEGNGNCVNASDGNGVTYEMVTPEIAGELNLAARDPNADFNVTVLLPSCKTTTFHRNETVVRFDSVTVTIGRAGPVKFDDFSLSSDNSSVTVCYPLSPQLLQCKHRRLHMPNYVTVANRALLNTVTNETIGFRDYYSNATTGDVIACNEKVNEFRKLRCNYVTLQPGEFNFTDESNVTLHLLPTNEFLYKPGFTQVVNVSGAINLCYPASPDFTMCPKLWYLEKQEFHMQSDHRLHSVSHRKTYDLGEFFIQTDKRAIVCANIEPPPAFDFFLIHASLYVVSAFCLLVAFIIHLVVPSLNYHAKPLLCHMLSMLVMYTSMALRKFMTNITPGPCYTLFITTYVSALASFFWLSVLAFDLWSIFANLQTSSRLGCRPWACGSKNKRFIFYSIYAWGFPLFLCAVAVILDTNSALQDALNLYPGIAKMCWFNNRDVAYLLLYGPLFGMLVINTTLFVLTVANLKKASKGAEVVNKKLNQQLLFVCIRLFIVMGLCWMVEAITWTLNVDSSAMYIPDLIIAVQGIIIFIIYICKPTTYRLLRRKFLSKRQPSASDTRWTTDGQSTKSQVEQKTSGDTISMNSYTIREKKKKEAMKNGAK